MSKFHPTPCAVCGINHEYQQFCVPSAVKEKPLSPSDVTACSGFARPAHETWRWYAWTRMKSSEPMRWIPTVWKADTEAEAEKKRDRALEDDDTIILVREVTTYIPNKEISD